MIRNDVSNETAHIVNWLLYSGVVDVPAMIEAAKADAAMSPLVRRAHQMWYLELVECLQCEVQAAVSAAVGIDNLEEYPSMIGNDADAYEHAPAEWLLGTIITHALGNVCWNDVAALLIEHVNQPATV